MIFNFKKRAGLLVSVTTFVILLAACNNPADKELEQSNVKADSLSIKLNSPELKAVNAELLEDPNNAGLYNKRAQLYISIKQLPEAVGDAKRAIRLDSTNAKYYNTLADAYFGQNETRLARELLEIIEKKFPDNTDALLKLAEIYFLVRQYQKGIDYANKALKIDAGLARAYFIKGSIYKESGDTAKAISSLETATEQDNNFEDAYVDLGVIYAARKNPMALDYYANALRLNPNNQNTIYARARLLQDLGKVDEALAAYQAIFKKDAQCDICCYNIGAIYLELKKDNKMALEYFTKAIEINPNYAGAYFARGYTYARLNDKESARADYKMCLKLKPNDENALQGINNL